MILQVVLDAVLTNPLQQTHWSKYMEINTEMQFRFLVEVEKYLKEPQDVSEGTEKHN